MINKEAAYKKISELVERFDLKARLTIAKAE
jgi:hypothetical protein